MSDNETTENQQQKEDIELDSSNDESEKGRSHGGSDHSSDDLDLAAEMMMHRSSSQEFKLSTSGNKVDKQQERNQGGKQITNDAQFNSSSSPTNNSSSGAAKTQSHNQKAPQQETQQPQQPVMQKSRPSNPSSTAEPNDQYTMMASHKQQQPLPPLQQQAKDTDRIDASQKFYSRDYNTWLPPSWRQVTKDKEMMGRDNREAQFHYAPNPKRIKQLPSWFQ